MPQPVSVNRIAVSLLLEFNVFTPGDIPHNPDGSHRFFSPSSKRDVNLHSPFLTRLQVYFYAYLYLSRMFPALYNNSFHTCLGFNLSGESLQVGQPKGATCVSRLA